MKPQAADLSRGKDYPSEPERAHWLPNQSAVIETYAEDSKIVAESIDR